MIVGALLAKDEAAPDRYLARALANARQFCDEIVVVDDGSTDDTVKVCQGAGCHVHSRFTNGEWFEGGEREARAMLWYEATKLAGPDGWVYLFDADHELVGITPEDFRLLTRSRNVNSWAFPLYDCWDSDELMRVDGFWQAHLHPRPWLFKALPDFTPEWPNRQIHVGHFPQNLPLVTGIAPHLAGVRHMGYIAEAHRAAKRDKYLALRDRMTPQEIAHAESITAPATLEPITKKPRILATSIVRKPAVVVEALKKTLAWQVLHNATLDILFLPNFATSDPFGSEALGCLQNAPSGFRGDYRVLPNVEAPTGDYGDGERTRTWTQNAFERVAVLKDGLLQEAVKGGYDYVWLIDADVLCDPYTLQSMVDASDSERQIVSGVYWTNWTRPTPHDAVAQHAGPQVWLVHPYGLSGRGWTEPEFREALITRQRVRVWGLGACTLVPRKAIEVGIRFQKTQQLPGGPMAEGEDRQFCAAANRLHYEMYADAWPDIYHAYHPDEYGKIPEVLTSLQRNGAIPRPGWLVSLTLRNLEIPAAPPQHVRGRLGSLDILPQIEEAVMGMKPGEDRLLRVVFPAHWPEAGLRNQTFTIHVKLLDAKPFRVAPVIDAELFVGSKSGRVMDQVSLTAQQCEDVVNG